MKVLVVTNMYPIPDMPAFGTFVREQVESLRQNGIEADVFFVNGRKNKLNYLWGIFRFWAWLPKRRYDLIHAHYVFSGIIARLQFLYPVILTHHGPEVFMTWERFPCRYITPLMDRVIVVSSEMKEKLGCKKAVVIPCGIDFELFKPMDKDEARRHLCLPTDRKLILWAGEPFRPEKRFELVKAALGLAQMQDPSVELVPVSGQPLNRVPLYMNACDALLLLSDAEGSPMVIKEAMACNLPIVSVPVGDVPQVIKGIDGCYLCSQDPKDAAQKLLLVLNPPRRSKGRERIANLELGHISRQIVALYEEVLQEKRPPSPFREFQERKHGVKG